MVVKVEGREPIENLHQADLESALKVKDWTVARDI